MKKILVIALLILNLSSNSQNALVIPDTISGLNFSLNVYDTSKVFYTGYPTTTYGVNGKYLGPTLILKKGDSISLSVNNLLPDTTTIHWHGLHVSSINDGGPHTTIPPNTVWNPKFKVRDLAATYWYHSHLHMKTNLQVNKGVAGLIIVRDSVEKGLNLPRRYGIDDFPIVVQSKAFDANKQITINNPYDSVMMVNGTIKPFLNAPAQVIRLRILNASTERVYNLGFTGNLSFYQVASDGGLLSNATTLTRLRVAPGERAEILLNLTGMQTQTINLISFASELPNGVYGAANPSAMGPGVITGYSSNSLNGTNFVVLQLNVVSTTSNPITTIPSSLTIVNPINTGLATVTRSLTFAPQTMGPNQSLNGPFVINGSSFNMANISYNIPKDNVEIWQLSNQTAIAHPFHIHDVQFYVIDINGSAPPANQAGRKDVVLVPAQQTVKFITKFETFCDSIPYMYHCHMLKHEDEGMMGQFKVNCAITSLKEVSNNTFDFSLYPIPFENVLNIELNNESNDELTKVVIYNSLGQIVYERESASTKASVNTTSWSHGLYFVHFNNGQHNTYKKIIK
jgi:blue copper oxidase